MGKPSGGGGGGSKIFSSSIYGPPPGNATCGSEHWIDLGTVPSGHAIWFGIGQFTSPDKALTFELRTNISGQSTGTIGNTLLLGAVSASPKTGTKLADFYKNGRLHTTSVIGSGPEHAWLRLKSKSGTSGGYMYLITYTTE